jgi:hypothetical protein
MIKTKKEFGKLLAESEQAFQAYIFCPSERKKEMKNGTRLLSIGIESRC